MTDREKLGKLLAESASIAAYKRGGEWEYSLNFEEIVDHLLAHGVTVKEPQKPLTVEELRKIIGSPVWVEVIDHDVFADPFDDFDGWGLVRTSWVRVWDETRADLVKVDYDFEDYLKEWRCWAEKPTEEERLAAEWEE